MQMNFLDGNYFASKRVTIFARSRLKAKFLKETAEGIHNGVFFLV